MPKLAKEGKAKRDRGVLTAIPKLFAKSSEHSIANQQYTPASLAKPFEDHLRAMARVRELTIALRQAVADERKLDLALRPILAGIKALVRARVGPHSSRMRDYGFEPDKKPSMSAHTKLLANVKRQATRQMRGSGRKKRRR
jgi:hypothetical protein